MPDGRHTLITIVRDDGGETAGVVDLKDGSVRDLGIRGHGFVYVAPRWIPFQQGTTLLAAAFDPDHPVRAANPVPVIEKVLSAPQATRDGTLIYIAAANRAHSWYGSIATGGPRPLAANASITPPGSRAGRPSRLAKPGMRTDRPHRPAERHAEVGTKGGFLNLEPLCRRKNAAHSWRPREKTFRTVLTRWQMAGLRQQ